MKIAVYNSLHPLSEDQTEQSIDFLFRHLGHFGDPRASIGKAIAYAMRPDAYAGGFVCMAMRDGELVGVAVVNHTGMESYIPENILVYIAIHAAYRGLGLGEELLTAVLAHAEGDVALHVDADNPARRLYERLGFVCAYWEMRLHRKEVP